MTAQGYCNLYRISPVVIPILNNLSQSLWYPFKRKDAIEGEITLNTGFYSGIGQNSKRESIAPRIMSACKKAGFKAWKFQEGGKGAKHEKVKIVIIPTATRQQFNNK